MKFSLKGAKRRNGVQKRRLWTVEEGKAWAENPTLIFGLNSPTRMDGVFATEIPSRSSQASWFHLIVSFHTSNSNLICSYCQCFWQWSWCRQCWLRPRLPQIRLVGFISPSFGFRESCRTINYDVSCFFFIFFPFNCSLPSRYSQF